MRQYLHAWGDSPDEFFIGVSDEASECVTRPAGRSSVLIPADQSDTGAELAVSGAVLFVVPVRPSQLLAAATHDLPTETGATLYLSHGHACAVFLCESVPGAEQILELLDGHVRAYEIWPHTDGHVRRGEVRYQPPTIPLDWIHPPQIEEGQVGPEAAAQIRQFNSNLALLSRVASQYAPEMQPLVSWLHESINNIADLMVEQRLAGGSAAARSLITLETTLIETNAVVTLFTSQLSSGTVPLHFSTFPVGEYSMLGIGSMSRAAWRIYEHLNTIFGEFDHAGIVQRRYSVASGFDPFAPSDRLTTSSWAGDHLNIETLSDNVSEGFRYHIPYFSSRWGFHEALHSISFSWQCLYASATKEWNLLTVTHEFLHAHVRDILAEIMQPEDDALMEELAQRYNRHERGRVAIFSMQMAYIESLVGIRGSIRAARKITGSPSESFLSPVEDTLSAEAVRDLVNAHSGMLHEIIVHVLDYFYFYAARPSEYVGSIWSSWSLVPSVVDQIEHYLLRTICTLSSTSDDPDSQALFLRLVQQLTAELDSLGDGTKERPAVRAARVALSDDRALKQLGVQFMGLRYVVELTKHFFLDARLNAAIFQDSITVVLNERRSYPIDLGSFQGDEIESPIGFLLDRFPSYGENQSGLDNVEYASVWQMLTLT